MKYFIALALIATVAIAAPQADKDAVIIKQESDNIGVDGYKTAFETSNGITQQEQARLENYGDVAALAVSGRFSYVGPDGVTYSVTYTADQDGYHPQGSHLPVAQ